MRPGPAMRLSKGSDIFTIMPYYDNFTLSAQQKTKAPIERAYKSITGALLNSAEGVNSTLGTILGLYQELSDLFGVKLGGKNFYSLAWDGGSQGKFTLKIKLHRGWNDIWNAKTEIADVLETIAEKTVPASTSATSIASPMPTPFKVMGDFIATSISDATSSFGSLVKIVPGAEIGVTFAGEVLSKGITGAVGLVSGALGVGASTWKVELGYWDGKVFKNMFQLSECIVTGSNMSFSKEVEKQTAPPAEVGNVYPISGELSLEMTTQSIIVNTHMGFNTAVSDTKQ